MPLPYELYQVPLFCFLVIFLSFFSRDADERACEHRFSYAGPLIRARSRRQPMIYNAGEPPPEFYIQINVQRWGWKSRGNKCHGISLIMAAVYLSALVSGHEILIFNHADAEQFVLMKGACARYLQVLKFYTRTRGAWHVMQSVLISFFNLEISGVVGLVESVSMYTALLRWKILYFWSKVRIFHVFIGPLK